MQTHTLKWNVVAMTAGRRLQEGDAEASRLDAACRLSMGLVWLVGSLGWWRRMIIIGNLKIARLAPSEVAPSPLGPITFHCILEVFYRSV